MFISLEMKKAFNIGWFPEDASDPCEEEQDIIIKASHKQINQGTCAPSRRMLRLRKH